MISEPKNFSSNHWIDSIITTLSNNWCAPPSNGVVIFAGDNRQGKTTILKALAILLFGKKALPNDFMTHNKRKFEIEGTFNNCIIKRTKTETGDLRVTITDSAGIPLSDAPQKFIDNFLNEQVINPHAFLEKDGNAI